MAKAEALQPHLDTHSSHSLSVPQDLSSHPLSIYVFFFRNVCLVFCPFFSFSYIEFPDLFVYFGN